MKVGVDIRVLGKGRRTGVEDYTINLFSHLFPLDKSIKYRLFYNGFKKPNLDYPFLKSSNTRMKILGFPNRIFDLFLRFLKFPKLDMLLNGVDIFLSPHFLLTPVSEKCKVVVIFYDLSFIRFPEFFSKPKLFWHKFVYPRTQAKKADMIVAISQSTKKDLIDLYKVKSEKIKVIYPGIDEKFKPIDKDDSSLERVREKYNLPDEFILYFGTIEPRKNVLGLIKAFEQIKSQKSKDKVSWRGFEGEVKRDKKRSFDFSNLHLVIAGSRGWLYDEVFEKAKESQYSKDIIFTGFVDEEDKVYLYNLANVFVYPSFFEGFGLPPLEAMSCGIPTIVSDKPSLPEVVGNGAIMVDPNNIDEISFAIREVLENQDLRRSLKNQGLKRAKNFNWDEAANEFLKLFKKL